MQIKDVLIINSYAGSLVLAAKKVGLPIRGSYEDAGYGMAAQRANFKDIDFRDKRADWPAKQDLSRTIVLAHPPCAAFSAQNVLPKNREKQGVDAPKFQCTIGVLEYAMRNNAAAVAIESVRGALEGAREVHDKIAKAWGYDVYRVLQNSKYHGVPQDRPRFWALFVRKGLVGGMTLSLKPTNSVSSDVLERGPKNDEEPSTQQSNRLTQARERLSSRLSHAKITSLLRGDCGYGRLCHVIKRDLHLPEETYHIAKFWVGRAFQSAVPHVLDPDKASPTLLGDNVWVYKGRVLTPSQYKRMMGFPPNYELRPASQILYLLSRGVVPAVAEWVLRELLENVEKRRVHFSAPRGTIIKTIGSGEIAVMEPEEIKPRGIHKAGRR